MTIKFSKKVSENIRVPLGCRDFVRWDSCKYSNQGILMFFIWSSCVLVKSIPSLKQHEILSDQGYAKLEKERWIFQLETMAGLKMLSLVIKISIFLCASQNLSVVIKRSVGLSPLYLCCEYSIVSWKVVAFIDAFFLFKIQLEFLIPDMVTVFDISIWTLLYSHKKLMQWSNSCWDLWLFFSELACRSSISSLWVVILFSIFISKFLLRFLMGSLSVHRTDYWNLSYYWWFISPIF